MQRKSLNNKIMAQETLNGLLQYVIQTLSPEDKKWFARQLVDDAFEKEQATLPENIKTRRNQELNDLYQRIQQTYQDNQQAMQKAQQEKMQAITTKVLDAIKAVGQEGNFVYIMEMGAGIPYISTTLSSDVTAQVKAKLGLK